MRRWIGTGIAAVTLLLLAAVTAALVGPGLLRDRAREWVATETGRSLEVGKVSVNLLALSLELRNVTLTETDRTTPFVNWERLFVAFSPRSLWHRAPIVRELQLDQPQIRIVRHPDGRFNFSDLLAEPTAQPAADDRRPARFSLNNLVVHGGRIDVIDQTLERPVTHRIDELELAVPFLGNLPYQADRYVQPLLSTRVNGTPFALKGELKPFADTREYLVKLKLDGIDLPRYLAYLPEPLPVAVHGGRLYLDLDLAWRAPADAEPVMELAGRVELTVLDLRERGGGPLLFLPLLAAQVAPSRPFANELHLTKLLLSNPQLWLTRDTTGTWNFEHGATSGAGAPAADRNDRDAAPLRLAIDQLQVRNGRLALRDQRVPGGFRGEAEKLAIDLTGCTLAEAAPCRIAAGFATTRGEQFEANGELTLRPFAIDVAIAAGGIPLEAYQPYYLAATAAPVKGTVDVRGRLQHAPDQPLRLSGVALELRDGDFPFEGGEGITVARLAIAETAYDSGANRLDLGSVALDKPRLRFSRSAEGHWSFMDRRYPLLAGLAEAGAPAAATPPRETQTPFSWRLGHLAISDGAIGFRDLKPAQEAGFALTGLQVAVRDLAAPEQVRSTFTLAGTLNRRGRLQLDGTAVAATGALTARAALARVPLRPFAPYLAEQTRIVLVDGELDARLAATAGRADGRWQGTLSGELDVRRLHTLDALHREDLMRWERLQITEIDGRLAPPRLVIGRLAVNDYYAKVLLDEQTRLNLVEAFAAPGDAAATAAPENPAADSPAAEIRIDRVTLQGGRVNFTDRHMPRSFTAEMQELGGRIEGLSSDPAARAEVDLRGQLQGRSPLSVQGTLNPLASPLFLDLALLFSDIELSPLSPYSGTYVGYLIDKGKLNVELRYLVEQGKLASTNKIFLDQLTFGDKVESDKATSLPVRLAVALLKDRNGEIHLDIPVSGSLDDPQFSVWGIIWQIVKNLLVKAATSPLALLGALAGGGEEVDAIVFPAGSAQLTGPESNKLEKIATALRDRPELKIEVRGYVDPDRDPEGYRRERLQAELRRAKHLDLLADKDQAAPAGADAVTLTAAEYPEYLWEVYKAADFPKPRNFIGMVRHLPDAELEKLLLANIRVGDEELAALAEARARAVAAALTTGGGIAMERVFLVRPDFLAVPAGDGAVRSRVEFGITVK